MSADKSSPYGYDTAIGPALGGLVDMATNGRACSGAELVRNALIGRSMADVIPMLGAPGGFIAWGIDVRKWVGSPLTEAIATQRQQALAIVYGRDPRVDRGSIAVTITKSLAGAQYDFGIAVSLRLTDTSKVSFTLDVTADKITVDSLAQNGTST